MLKWQKKRRRSLSSRYWKEEKKVVKEIKVLEEKKTVSKKEVGKLKRKLTTSKKKTEKMQEAYDNDEVESAEDFLRQFAKNK